MPTDPFPIVTAAEMRELERSAFGAGISEAELQETAGRGVGRVVDALAGRRSARVLALCGGGNNGRDAVVAMRYLRARGHSARVWLTERHAVTVPEIQQLERLGIEVQHGAESRLDDVRAELRRSDIVIDGLLGIGARGAPRTGMAAMLEAVNAERATRSDLRILAVDVPSGVDVDGGRVPGAAVRADTTVVLGAFKRCHLLFPAAQLCGRLCRVSIGLPSASLEACQIVALDEDWLPDRLPERRPDSHKYRHGRVLVVAGSEAFSGAAALVARSAARSGCGLVAVVAVPPVQAVVRSALPEAVFPLASDAEFDAARVIELLPRYQVLVIGPGLGTADAAVDMVRTVLAARARVAPSLPTVVDADGLNALAEWPRWWERIGGPCVLTPHVGEMDRLDRRESSEAPWNRARRCAAEWGQVVVLKGSFTAVAEPGGRCWVNPVANAALATAGTGDVLAGLCGGLMAQGCGSADAARLAVGIHSEAGVRAAREQRSILASDVIDALPPVMHRNSLD
jgi:NAD(P)H-hydrate epimerase